jgi:hypothetical protein
MTISVDISSRSPVAPSRRGLGDKLAVLADGYAARMNEGDFATALRRGRLDRRSYVAFLAMMYPAVVGFNRALIRSIAKVDHVRQSSLVRALAKQLHEEQAHNQMWRASLAAFGVDHEALYSDLEQYLARFDRAELDRLTARVVSAVSHDLSAGATGQFPNAPFPDAVLALYHHLETLATRASISHWEHFGSQASIEMIIFNVVSASILPGIRATPALDLGAATTGWWRAHGEIAGEEDGSNEERRHLELSRSALNRSAAASMHADAVLERAEATMQLFAAALLCQPAAAARFPLERYAK